MISATRNTNGFTIVELLIVIVIIAILASVSVMAFNGITTRAENTKTLSAVSAYVKAMQLHATKEGRFPRNNPAEYVCLPDNNNCGSEGGTCSGIGAVAANTSNAVYGEFKTILSALPSPSTQKISCASGGASAKLSGILYL